MNVFAFILAVLAFGVFLIHPSTVAPKANYWWDPVRIGLALLTAAWVVELLTTHRQVHF